ncbi:hypothetical protein DYI42_19470 [Vannielia litorea]|nr:hypothetical protein [Vannielia litorea]
MAGLLSGVFGGVVTHTPDGGAGMATEIEGVFREDPVDLPGEDNLGELRWITPTLAVTEPVALTLEEGDVIEPGNGKSYRVQPGAQPSGSPAADRFWTFPLEEIE